MRRTLNVTAHKIGLERFIPAHAENTSAKALPLTRPTVHPRACGEHQRRQPGIQFADGSSPRMRRTHFTGSLDAAVARFIPAHAENTGATGKLSTCISVHPRACGEHDYLGTMIDRADGSSPRMRRTLQLFQHFAGVYRFIPAHAENTEKAVIPPRLITVHPRACGEHMLSGCAGISATGSSPRMRRTRHELAALRRYWRFIPAHAENTDEAVAPLRMFAVHPRACGEHGSRQKLRDPVPGSSPRMRRTRHASSAAISGTSVHPRACGEHVPEKPPPRLKPGSSPRMRRTLSSGIPTQGHFRFIPAHAENTSDCQQGSRQGSVHPRACGEHGNDTAIVNNRAGSSPRMRRTHFHVNGKSCYLRFIPAHAENTRGGWPLWLTNPVHPRACGEHRRRRNDIGGDDGSSPRMRRTLFV